MTDPCDAPIACTLDSAARPQRLTDWQRALARVTARERVNGGLRLSFGADVEVAEIAQLAQAEHGCCSFFAFAITVDARGIALEVRAPDDAAELVDSLFGSVA